MYSKEKKEVKIGISAFFGVSAVIYIAIAGICIERSLNASKINEDFDLPAQKTFFYQLKADGAFKSVEIENSYDTCAIPGY